MFPALSCLARNGLVNIEEKSVGKVIASFVCTDLIIFISALTLGILGSCSVIHNMPTEASYALIGTAALIIFAWSALCLIKNSKNNSK